jgi:hypothetical protein
MRAFLSPDDLKKGDIIPTGWHPAELVDYTEADAKTDGSTNCNFFFKVLDGPAKGNTVKRLFNEKALGFGKNLWATLGLPYDAEKGYELTTELFKAQLGKKLMIYSKKATSTNGNDYNDVTDFRPLTQ